MRPIYIITEGETPISPKVSVLAKKETFNHNGDALCNAGAGHEFFDGACCLCFCPDRTDRIKFVDRCDAAYELGEIEQFCESVYHTEVFHYLHQPRSAYQRLHYAQEAIGKIAWQPKGRAKAMEILNLFEKLHQ